MGALVFHTVAVGADLNGAFEQARADAAHEYGTGGYSGSVYEKDSVTLIDEAPRTETRAVARANELIDQADSRIDAPRGPAGALPVVTDDAQRGWLIFGWAAH
ncbi:hypothetical protein [Streptomyces sp. NPDC090026]|uniref:hypothetical protein n=1 Tax=Streptomyces sp. NPDC090026 TaxID=3365923 RepID=UPI00382AF49F